MTDEAGEDPRAGSPGLLPVFLVVVVVLVAAVAGAWALGARVGDDEGDEPAPSSVEPPSTAVSVVPTTEPVPTEATATYEAACAGGLVAAAAPGVADPNLVEVSGLAVDRSGVAWVINDSGDRPRIYGVRADGSVQTVEVAGADAVDWEDVVLQHAGDGSVLWIADTGANIEPRTTVQLYRVPVPAVGETSVEADRFDVTYPDGSHDVEALVVEPSGSLFLITKDPGTPAVYRVEPSSPAPAAAELVGTFSVGDGERTVVTGADLASDGSAVVLRTYGSVYLVPVEPAQPLIEALGARDGHCRGVPPFELQGEAISFLPDGSGYVTMGEGRNPYLTTATVDPDAAPSG